MRSSRLGQRPRQGQRLERSATLGVVLALAGPTGALADPTLTILRGFSVFEDAYLRSDRLDTDQAGNLYGVVRDSNALTRRAFKLAPDGASYAVLVDFPVPETESVINTIPIADNRGNLYFAVRSYASAASFEGVVDRLYRLAADGSSFDLVHTFSGASPWPAFDFNQPDYGLIADSTSNLYGTTRGGFTDEGTVFRLAPDGTFTVLHTFEQAYPATDGFAPSGGLAIDSAGNLYGMTSAGGMALRGTIYRLTPDGSYSVLHTFCGETDCRDGSYPVGELTIDGAGNLYGATSGGGDATCAPTPGSHEKGCGTLFRLAKDGTFMVLHAFRGGPNDGKVPGGGLIADIAGTLYGTTRYGGAGTYYYPGRPEYGIFSGFGTVYKLAPDGSGFALLHSFSQDDDLTGNPASRLTVDSAGNLYGIAWTGPLDPCFRGYNCGTVFKLSGTGFVTATRFEPFRAKLEIEPDGTGSTGSVDFSSSFVLSTKSNGIDPVTEPVTLKVGAFTATLPPGSFERRRHGHYRFEGTIGAMRVEASIRQTGTLRYGFDAEAKGANLDGITNPVSVTLTIGDDSGTTSAKVDIDRQPRHRHWRHEVRVPVRG